jgi:hypothetical protein
MNCGFDWNATFETGMVWALVDEKVPANKIHRINSIDRAFKGTSRIRTLTSADININIKFRTGEFIDNEWWRISRMNNNLTSRLDRNWKWSDILVNDWLMNNCGRSDLRIWGINAYRVVHVVAYKKQKHH